MILLEALLESNRRFHDLLGNAELVSLILDRNARISYCNDYFLRLTGWSREEILGRDYFEVFAPAPYMTGVFGSLLAEHPAARHHENDILTKSGDRKLIRWNNTVLRSANGAVTGTVSIGEDITRTRELEAKLRGAQRLEAIGRLGGGIAHDFNNMLSPIMGYATLLHDSFPENDPRRTDTEEIRKIVTLAASLTKQFLDLGRPEPRAPRPLNINRLIVDVESMLRRALGGDIELVLRLAPQLGEIKAEPAQIVRVVMNLLVNARDAMPNGGKITLSTGEAEIDANDDRGIPKARPGRHIYVAVSDSGKGVSREAMARMFEPFFSTKTPGRGTGLGLLTVREIVEEYGGSIFVDNAPGKGATFKICLPRVGANPS